MSIKLAKRAREMAEKIIELLKLEYEFKQYQDKGNYVEIYIPVSDLLRKEIDISAIYLPLLWLHAAYGIESWQFKYWGKLHGYIFRIPKSVAERWTKE
ncbi:MAG: hypothetical protein QXF74_05610 [Nitrososphaerota archaeon]